MAPSGVFTLLWRQSPQLRPLLHLQKVDLAPGDSADLYTSDTLDGLTRRSWHPLGAILPVFTYPPLKS